MAQTTAPKSREREEAESLRGTLASVLILGALIVVSWFGVFFLFLSRG